MNPSHKILLMMKRRPGMTPEAFRDYYEHHHVPLSARCPGTDPIPRAAARPEINHARLHDPDPRRTGARRRRDGGVSAHQSRKRRRFAATLTPLVVNGAIEAVEGPTPDGVIVLQFPTVEDAKAWYESPAYQKALPFRKQSATYRAMIVQGL